MSREKWASDLQKRINESRRNKVIVRACSCFWKILGVIRREGLRLAGRWETLALHTLHLQQTAGDPRRSLSSRLLSTPLWPFRPSALSFPPLSRLTRYFSQASRASILDSFDGEQAQISETKNAFGSIVSTWKNNLFPIFFHRKITKVISIIYICYFFHRYLRLRYLKLSDIHE